MTSSKKDTLQGHEVTMHLKALSTLATIVAEFGHCRQKRRLSPNSPFRQQIVAEIGDYSLQCGQAIMVSNGTQTVTAWSLV